jgi:hypothetical protein
VQENILASERSDGLRVYVIWLPMLVTDSRSEVERSLIDDPRVRHFWDGGRVTGSWFAQADIGGLGYSGVIWDAYFLFGPDATWDDKPAPLVDFGAPVVSYGEQLRKALRSQL